MNSFSILRGVNILAGGEVSLTNNELKLTVAVSENDPKQGIVQSPFVLQKVKTVSFKRAFKLANNKLSYTQEMVLVIYSKTFAHTDKNTFTKE
ncbi:hypothetical protein PHEL85_0843 [Polaribacter sp. Hel1_85]|nr:hypothetical protein PHEL85_0843 [Polaribacter sp. Hel1_85]